MLFRIGGVGLGLVIMCGAWMLEHPERHVWFVRLLDPTGYSVVSCYETLSNGETVTLDTDGFAPVAAIIVRELTIHVPGRFFPQMTVPVPATELLQEGRLEISRASSSGEKSGLLVGGIGVGRAYLRNVVITYSFDQESLEAGPFEIAGFRNELVEKYVDNPVFRGSFVFFVAGLAFFVMSTSKLRGLGRRE